MPAGVCRLCVRPHQQLLDSHFMPAGVYRIARDPSAPDPNPVIVSQSVSLHSSKQAKDYLLCTECEDQFDKGGETWFLRNCWHNPTEFPVFAALKATRPSPKSEPQFSMYEGANVPGVDMDKLAYFAASLFWRAGVHDWKLIGDPPPTRLQLGPHEELLRQYLMGGPFPKGAVLVIIVSSDMDPMLNKMTTFPWLFTHDKMFRQYRCVVLGFTFQLFIGKEFPLGLRQMCSVRTPEQFIYMTPDADWVNVKNNAALVRKTRKVGSLARVR